MSSKEDLTGRSLDWMPATHLLLGWEWVGNAAPRSLGAKKRINETVGGPFCANRLCLCPADGTRIPAAAATASFFFEGDTSPCFDAEDTGEKKTNKPTVTPLFQPPLRQYVAVPWSCFVSEGTEIGGAWARE